MMFDETSFSLDAFSQDAWLFLLDVPYFDLTGKQRVYVRSVVDSVYLSSEAEKIISFAGANNLSVVDAVTALRVSTAPLQTYVKAAMERAKRIEEARRIPDAPSSTNVPANAPIYVASETSKIAVRCQSDTAYATEEFVKVNSLFCGNTLFVFERNAPKVGRM